MTCKIPLAADLRKQERVKADAERFEKLWSAEGLTWERARSIANYDHTSRCYTLAEYPRELPVSQYEGPMGLWSALDGIITAEQAVAIAILVHQVTMDRAERWIQHLTNRIEYERAMLGDNVVAERPEVNLEVGGRVLIRKEWVTILKLNKKGGKVVSVSTTARFVSVRGVEEIEEYQPPAPGMTEKVKAATALPPLCNYPGEGFRHMTKAEYEAHVPKWSDFSKIENVSATEQYGRHRVRRTRKDGEAFYNTVRVFLTDQKLVEPPAVRAAQEVTC